LPASFRALPAPFHLDSHGFGLDPAGPRTHPASSSGGPWAAGLAGSRLGSGRTSAAKPKAT
jgi:hypothetical protein